MCIRDRYGIGSFVYRRNIPFHPKKFLDFVQQKFPLNVIRSKGLFWIASRNDQALNFSSAGGSIKADAAGVWWASMPFSERIKYASFIDNQEEIESGWEKDFGDRKIELVFIGQNLNVDAITHELDLCLLNENELVDLKSGNLSLEDSWPIPNL